MISNHIKDFIEEIIKKYSYKNDRGMEVKIVKNARDEDKLRTNRQFPFFSLLTANGSVEEKGISNYVNWKENGKEWSAYIRGILKMPLEVRVFAETEEEANNLLFETIRNVPDKWQLGNYKDRIELGEVAISDWSSSLLNGTLASCFVNFYMPIATTKKEVITTFIKGEQDE